MDERRTLSLNVFLNTLEEGCKNERRYCFILGAGASKTSGIPTGEELAKQWHGEILEQCSKEEIKELKKRLGVRSTKPSSRAYFDLYAMRFFPDYQNGSAFLERTLEKSYGVGSGRWSAPSPAWATIPWPPCWPTRATTW